MRTVEEAIPHRPPFLFVDSIVDVSEDRVVAKRTIRADEPQFQGHYPGRPVMPGVLLLEAMMQAGCYLMVHRFDGKMPADGVPVVARMNDVKFKRMVVPGDEIELTAELEKSMRGVYFMKGKVTKEGKVAASATFAVTVAPEDAG